MKATEELYGLHTIYYGLDYSSQLSSMPSSYLESCARSLIASPDDSALSQGSKSGLSVQTTLPEFEFDEKFMKVLEKHLVNLEEEVPDIKPAHEIKVEVKKKKKKNYHFNDSVHKKSIISEHMKTSKCENPSPSSQLSASFYNVYRRKPRD